MLNWEPAWYYKVGATRYFDNGWSLSAGYMYSENAIPDAHYTPLVGTRLDIGLSVGTGFKRRRFNFDIAYQLGFGDGVRTVSGSDP